MPSPIKKPSPRFKVGVSERPNTIGLRGEQLLDVFNGLDAGERPEGDRRRQHSRLPFRVVSVKVRIQKSIGNFIDLKLACRNLSSGGTGLLHSSYVHVGTRVVVELPMGKEGVVAVEGEVARCRHIQGTVHEVGVKFDTPIDVREFANPDPSVGWFSVEAIEEESLEGTVVHATASNRVRSRLRTALNGTRLRIRNAETINDVVGLAAKGASIIIADWMLDGGDAETLCKRLERVGIAVRVIVLGPSIDEPIRHALRNGSIAAFAKLPIDKSVLLRAIAEFAVEPEVVDLEESSAESDEQTGVEHSPAAKGFSCRAPGFAQAIADGLAADAPMEIYSACTQIAALAEMAGATGVARRASGIAEALSGEMSLAPVVSEVASLLRDCMLIAKPEAGGSPLDEAAELEDKPRSDAAA